MILNRVKQRITSTPGIGLIPDEPDSRDFQFGIFFDTYRPKHEQHRIKTVSVKNQTGRNDCTFQSSVAGKEVDEGIQLSVRGNVIWAKEHGMISGDGFSTLRNSQKVLKHFGAVPETKLPSFFKNWRSYTDSRYLTEQLRQEAAKHKTDSYWKLSSLDEVYKALDEGRPVQSALQWFSGYNRGGVGKNGILTYQSGSYVGGHAVLTVGYQKDRFGHDVMEVQNSFSWSYGVGGSYFMKVEDYIRELTRFGAYVNMDIAVDTAKFLNEYNGKAVKAQEFPEIYEIRAGKKYHLSPEEFVKKFTSFNVVDQALIKSVPNG